MQGALPCGDLRARTSEGPSEFPRMGPVGAPLVVACHSGRHKTGPYGHGSRGVTIDRTSEGPPTTPRTVAWRGRAFASSSHPKTSLS